MMFSMKGVDELLRIGIFGLFILISVLLMLVLVSVVMICLMVDNVILLLLFISVYSCEGVI